MNDWKILPGCARVRTKCDVRVAYVIEKLQDVSEFSLIEGRRYKGGEGVLG